MHRLAQCRVIGAGGGFNDATCDHLARTRASARGIKVKIESKTVAKTAEGGSEIPIWLGQFGPAPERSPMLGFLFAPAPGGLLKREVVVENPAQMVRVGPAIMFDKARRLDDRDDLRVELVEIEPVPANIVESPRAHAAPSGICDVPLLHPQGRRCALSARPKMERTIAAQCCRPPRKRGRGDRASLALGSRFRGND